MPVNFNLLRQAGPANFAEGLMQGQDQQNALLQQQQQRQLSDIQLRNALRGEQEAMAETEAVKGAASLEDLAGRYRKAGLGKQALATEAALAKQRTDKLAAAKTQTELLKTSATRIMNRPESAIQELQRYQQLTGVDMSDDIAEVQQMAPEQVKAWASGHALEADKLLPKFQSMSVPGVGVQTGTTDFAGRFTPGQVFKEQMSEAQKAQNQIAQGQLGVAQQRLAWEKANPGYEVKEGEDGTMYGVNKRTLQAVPITIGAAAPAGGAPVAGVSAGAAPAGGAVPFKGKGTALTESQGNATAYGMRMKEANSILEDLSKKGVLKGAVVESTPLVGGVLGRALPSALGGTSEAQQQVNQAKANFITAVLRKESGAVISDSEFDRENEKYFPQINDNDAVIKQKANARKTAIRAMEIQAGPGAKQMGGASGLPGANPNDPLGLGIGGR
jgi:hypothetical protein